MPVELVERHGLVDRDRRMLLRRMTSLRPPHGGGIADRHWDAFEATSDSAPTAAVSVVWQRGEGRVIVSEPADFAAAAQQTVKVSTETRTDAIERDRIDARVDVGQAEPNDLCPN